MRDTGPVPVLFLGLVVPVVLLALLLAMDHVEQRLTDESRVPREQ